MALGWEARPICLCEIQTRIDKNFGHTDLNTVVKSVLKGKSKNTKSFPWLHEKHLKEREKRFLCYNTDFDEKPAHSVKTEISLPFDNTDFDKKYMRLLVCLTIGLCKEEVGMFLSFAKDFLSTLAGLQAVTGE